MASGTWTTKDELDALRRAQQRAADAAATAEQRDKATEDVAFWRNSLHQRGTRA